MRARPSGVQWLRIRRETTDELLEVVLSTVSPWLIPEQLGWRIAHLSAGGRLGTEEGFRVLLSAARKCEPEKTTEILKRLRSGRQ